MNSISEIKALHRGHWFDKDTMRFFGSEVAEEVYPSPAGTYFVTSELDFEGRDRRYSVRLATLVDGRAEIYTVGEFRWFATFAEAHRAARRLAV